MTDKRNHWSALNQGGSSAVLGHFLSGSEAFPRKSLTCAFALGVLVDLHSSSDGNATHATINQFGWQGNQGASTAHPRK